jgi:hypothetical protein
LKAVTSAIRHSLTPSPDHGAPHEAQGTLKEREQLRVRQLLAELRDDPELLREIHAVLRERGYGPLQIGEAADDYQVRPF